MSSSRGRKYSIGYRGSEISVGESSVRGIIGDKDEYIVTDSIDGMGVRTRWGFGVKISGDTLIVLDGLSSALCVCL